MASSSVRDPSSLATFNAETTHIALDLLCNFGTSTLSGSATLDMIVREASSSISLDTRDLSITAVQVNGAAATYSLGEVHAAFGQALVITLPSAAAIGDKLSIAIQYSTSPASTAIQWLEPSQTSGKVKPFVFSQCQAIHARSLLPCQDSPSVKATYSARVSVADAVVVMSATVTSSTIASDPTALSVFTFEQKVPIPSYLIAFAAGQLQSQVIGPRSTLWAEKEVLAQGAHEFAETERFIQIAEEIAGPYRFNNYDLLLLPPSFPYGGMENPQMTFVTPTLLAGDRSLANVVAHEIAHSWSGNLVTNSKWSEFWLNEGWTVFIERKILGRLNGEKVRQFDSIIGLQDLHDSVEHYGCCHEFTKLIPNLEGVDPDDAFSSVPYEKGYHFIYELEQRVGGPAVFEPFVRQYFDNFAYKSISSEDFKDFFLSYFADKVSAETLSAINWPSKFFTAGMPEPQNQYDRTLSNECDQLVNKWVDFSKSGTDFGAQASDISSWTTRQKVYFFEQFTQKAAPVPLPVLKKMNEVYSLSAVRNSEVRFKWQMLCLKSEDDEILPQVVEFVTSMGRMKFARPGYRALFAHPRGRDLAVETFNAHRSSYHSIASKMIAKDLGLQ